MAITIKKKLTSVLVLYAVLCVLIMLYVGKNLLDNRRNTNLSDAALNEAAAATEVRSLINRQIKEVLDAFMADEDDDETEEFEDLERRVTRALADWHRLTLKSMALGGQGEQQDLDAIEAIQTHYQTAVTFIDEAFDQIASNDRERALALLKETLEPFVDDVLLTALDRAIVDDLSESPRAYERLLVGMGSVPWIASRGASHIDRARMALRKFAAVDTVRNCITRQMKEACAYILTREMRDHAEYEAFGLKARDAFLDWRQLSLAAPADGPAPRTHDAASVSDAEEIYREAVALTYDCFNLGARTGEEPEAEEANVFDILEDEVEPLVDDELMPALNAVALAELEGVKAALAALRRTLIIAGIAGLFLVALLIGGAFLVVTGILVSVLRSAERLTQAAYAVGRGSLEYRIAPGGQDELGAVAEAFNKMTENLAEAQQALVDSEERSRSVLQTAPDSILNIDREGTILFANRSWAGASKSALLQKRIYDLLPASCHATLRTAIDGVFAQGDPDLCELELASTEDQASIWLSCRIGPMRQAGKVTAATIISTDVTKEKHAQREKAALEMRLRHSQKMEAVGTLAGGIAHDFNNILGSMVGFTDLVMETLPKDSIEHQNLQRVMTAGLRAKTLIKQILTFSRKDVPQSAPIALYPIVEEVLHLLRSTLPSTITLQTDIDASDRRVVADPTQIHQLLLNLGHNAKEAMEEEQGVLTIKLADVDLDSETLVGNQTLSPGPYVELVVKDSGTGIAPETMDRIFEPFFTTKPVDKGTGMGLATVHGIIENHGGAIQVNSQVGVGTEFKLFFPTASPEGESTVPETGEVASGEHETILLVDDEPYLVDAVQQMLERMGYRVVAYTSSVEAVKHFEASPGRFDLIMTDYAMPGMSGKEVIRSVKKVRPDMPVILCTGYCAAMSDETIKALGIADVLNKPIVRSELAASIQKALAKRGVPL